MSRGSGAVSNMNKAQDLCRTVSDLEAVVARGTFLPNNQVAKLYGFTEKLLTTKIDNMQVTEDGMSDEGPGRPELKRIRKDLVVRSNALLDRLEKRREGKGGVHDGSNSNISDCDSIGLGINMCEDDELQLSVVLGGGGGGKDQHEHPLTALSVGRAKLQPSLNSSSCGSVAGDLLSAAYQPPVQMMLTNGFISALPAGGVVARHDATPYAAMCARGASNGSCSGSSSGKELYTVHTHAAAAIALSNLCPPPTSTTSVSGDFYQCMFISFTAGSFHFSVVRIRPSSSGSGSDSSGNVEFLFSRQVSLTTRGSPAVLATAAASLVPTIMAALNDKSSSSGCGSSGSNSDASLLPIDYLVVASSGVRTDAIFSALHGPLAEALPGVVPVLAPMLSHPLPSSSATTNPDTGEYECASVGPGGVQVGRDFVAYGAAVLDRVLHAGSSSGTAPAPVITTVINEPLSCIIGVRARVMPARTYATPDPTPASTPASTTAAATADDFDALLTAIPFFLPSTGCPPYSSTPYSSSASGVYAAERTLDLMSYSCSGEGGSGGSSGSNLEELFIEVVQVELGWAPGSGCSSASWTDGVLQTAVLPKLPTTAGVAKSSIGGLNIGGGAAAAAVGMGSGGGSLVSSRGPFVYRVIGRFPVKRLHPPIATATVASKGESGSDSGAVKVLQRVRVRLQLDEDRRVRVGLCSIAAVEGEKGSTTATNTGTSTPAVWDLEELCDLGSESSTSGSGGRSSVKKGDGIDNDNDEVYYLTDACEADQWKQQGNTILKSGHVSGGSSGSSSSDDNWDEFNATERAVDAYSLALQWDALNAVLYSNRCAARLKLCALQRMRPDPGHNVDTMLAQSLTDAQLCVQLRPTWSKGHSRLGEVLYRQNRLEGALEAYSKAYSWELAEKNISASSPPGDANKNSSIYKSLAEVQGAWDLQVATKAAQVAEQLLKRQANGEADVDGNGSSSEGGGIFSGSFSGGNLGPKKKKRSEGSGGSSSKCIVS